MVIKCHDQHRADHLIVSIHKGSGHDKLLLKVLEVVKMCVSIFKPYSEMAGLVLAVNDKKHVKFLFSRNLIMAYSFSQISLLTGRL